MLTVLVMMTTLAQAVQDEPWAQWLTPSGLKDIVETGGVVVLAYLLFTGRVITERMHANRTADLTDHHAREIAEKDRGYNAMVEAKDRAYDEMKESRDYYREARLEEKLRADRATEQLVEGNEVARAATQALVTLSAVAGERTT